jgi:NTP pyrophosphatase (non-canonical NTP hydrolase)
MIKLIKRHYQAIVNRGLITDKTTVFEFSAKIQEEASELSVELLKFSKFKPNNYKQESIDLVMTVFNMLQHYGVDIKKELLKNIEIQEKRADEAKQLK